MSQPRLELVTMYCERKRKKKKEKRKKKKEKRKKKKEKKKQEAYVRIGNETHQHRRHRVAKNVISKHAEGGCNSATFFRD